MVTLLYPLYVVSAGARDALPEEGVSPSKHLHWEEISWGLYWSSNPLPPSMPYHGER